MLTGVRSAESYSSSWSRFDFLWPRGVRGLTTKKSLVTTEERFARLGELSTERMVGGVVTVRAGELRVHCGLLYSAIVPSRLRERERETA